MKFMWGQKQSAMLAEAMLLNFAEDNHIFTLTEKMDDVLREHKDGFSFIYFTEKVIQDGFSNGKHYLDKKSTKEILNKIQEVRKNFLGFTTTPKNDLLQSFKEYKKHLLLIQKVFRASDPSTTKLVEDKIMKTLNENEFIIATTPIEIDLIQKEIIDLSKMRNDEDEILKHIIKYPANFCNTWTFKEMKEHLVRRINEKNEKKLSEEIEEIITNKKELAKKQEVIFRKYPEIQWECELLQTLALTRLELKHCWAGAETLCLYFLKEIAKKSELGFTKFMESYNLTDTLSLLREGKKLTEEEILNRSSYSIIHYKNQSLKYLFGQEAKDHFTKLIQTTSKDLKGVVANKGKVKGKVKIINVEDLKQLELDVSNFKEGEILVTTMTSPAMMVLAKKASAIITNEGGICSHAAIISRELNIPCIVGTHDATRVLKTGDFIEVDAKLGVVRKCQK
jgi:rifampicin phosphotransferase